MRYCKQRCGGEVQDLIGATRGLGFRLGGWKEQHLSKELKCKQRLVRRSNRGGGISAFEGPDVESWGSYRISQMLSLAA